MLANWPRHEKGVRILVRQTRSKLATHRVELPIRKPRSQHPNDRPRDHIRRVVPIIHRPRDRHERRAAQRRKQEPRLPGVSSSVGNAHFCRQPWPAVLFLANELAAEYRIRYHMPAHAKLLCPLGNDLKPSCSMSVRVQTVQSTRPCTGLDVSSAGSWQRAKRSGRGRPAVI